MRVCLGPPQGTPSLKEKPHAGECQDLEPREKGLSLFLPSALLCDLGKILPLSEPWFAPLYNRVSLHSLRPHTSSDKPKGARLGTGKWRVPSTWGRGDLALQLCALKEGEYQ